MKKQQPTCSCILFYFFYFRGANSIKDARTYLNRLGFMKNRFCAIKNWLQQRKSNTKRYQKQSSVVYLASNKELTGDA
jgi:hypothetical protein